MIKPTLFFSALLLLAACGEKEPKTSSGDAFSVSAVAVCGSAQTLEAGCAACVYKMPGAKTCALAVKVDGNLVAGTPRPGRDSGI